MTLLSDIVMDGSEIEIEGGSVGIRPIGGDRRFVFDPGSGRLRLHGDDDSQPRIELDGSNATGTFGNEGRPGEIDVRNASDETMVRLDGSAPKVAVYSLHADSSVVEIDGKTATVSAGASGDIPHPGRIEVKRDDETVTASLDGNNGSLTLGGGSGDAVGGSLEFRNDENDIAGSIEVDSNALVFKDASGTEQMRIDENGVTEP